MPDSLNIANILPLSLKQPAGGTSYYARSLPKSILSSIVKISVKLHLQAFWQNFEYGKMQKFSLCLQDLQKSSTPKLLNRIFRYCTQMVLEYVLLKFVQMVAPPTLLVK